MPTRTTETKVPRHDGKVQGSTQLLGSSTTNTVVMASGPKFVRDLLHRLIPLAYKQLILRAMRIDC
jgi:hypothetical protein